jgi:hypothetical protein
MKQFSATIGGLKTIPVTGVRARAIPRRQALIAREVAIAACSRPFIQAGLAGSRWIHVLIQTGLTRSCRADVFIQSRLARSSRANIFVQPWLARTRRIYVFI